MVNITSLIEAAEKAGHAAAAAAVVTPMNVVSGTTVYHVPDGVCGFAWVNIKPATSKLAKELVAAGKARKDGYYGGVTVWVSEFNQSMQLKEAYARAYAKVLTDAGFRAYASSRMD